MLLNLEPDLCGVCREELGARNQWNHEGVGAFHPFHSRCIREVALHAGAVAIPCPICRLEIAPLPFYFRWYLEGKARLVALFHISDRMKAIGLIAAGVLMSSAGAFSASYFLSRGGSYLPYMAVGSCGMLCGFKIGQILERRFGAFNFIPHGQLSMIISGCVSFWVGTLVPS